MISLLDSAHIDHEVAVRWFRSDAVVHSWATWPITENGFVRVLSSPGYPNLRLTPGLALESLARFKAGFSGIYQFSSDEVSMTDSGLFD